MAAKTGIKWTIDTRELDSLIKGLPNQIDNWLAQVCEEILLDIVMSFGSGPPGRRYRRRKGTRGRWHTASSPGFPPNVDIGTLQASLYWYKVKPGLYRVSDQVEYGIYLELGTENMIKRPFVAPVFEEWRNGKLAESGARAGLLQ